MQIKKKKKLASVVTLLSFSLKVQSKFFLNTKIIRYKYLKKKKNRNDQKIANLKLTINQIQTFFYHFFSHATLSKVLTKFRYKLQQNFINNNQIVHLIHS